MTDIQRVNKFDRFYKIITTLMAIVAGIAIVLIFVQIYSINVKINNEVNQIRAAQTKNRTVTNDENSVILSYLQCIALIPYGSRTPAVVQSCVDNAKKSNLSIVKQ